MSETTLLFSPQEKTPLSEEGYIVANGTTPSRGEMFEKQFSDDEQRHWLQEESGIVRSKPLMFCRLTDVF